VKIGKKLLNFIGGGSEALRGLEKYNIALAIHRVLKSRQVSAPVNEGDSGNLTKKHEEA
jgi:hypothetical protein